MKRTRLRAVSKRESENLERKKAAYEKMDNTRELICGGCGQHNFLSHSHLISQRNKELQSDPDNIFYDCMQREMPDQFGHLGCHARTESSDWAKFNTLRDVNIKLEYLKIHNYSRYVKLMLSKNEFELKKSF